MNRNFKSAQKMEILKQKMRYREKMIQKNKEYLGEQRRNIETEQGEHLLQYWQEHFKEQIALVNQNQIFSLKLDFGEYSV